MGPLPALAALEERLSDAVRAWNDEAYEHVLDGIAAHIEAAEDPDAALLEFDQLVAARIDHLAGDGETALANVYGAAVQDFYEANDLGVLAAYVVLHRAEVLIVGDHPDIAEQELREVYRSLQDERDPLCGAAACLLGRAIALQGRLVEALPVLEDAVEVAIQEQTLDGAAEATDLLGHVYQELGCPSDAARSFGQAAEMWRQAGHQAEAAESLRALAAVEIGVAGQAAEAERYDDCEEHARRAMGAVQGVDDVMAATAAVMLGGARLRLGSPGDAQNLIEPALAVLRPLDHPKAMTSVAVALLALGEAQALQSDLVGADRSFREAVDCARKAGDEALAELASLQVAVITAPRVDPNKQEVVLRHLGGEAASPQIRMLAAQNAGMLAIRAGDFATAQQHLEEALRRARDLARSGNDGASRSLVDISLDAAEISLNAMLMIVLAAQGRRDAAEARLTAIEDSFAAARRRGETDLTAALAPYLEIYRGLIAVTRGDVDEVDRRFSRAGELFLTAGASLHAAVTSTVMGLLALRRETPDAAAEFLVPAVLAARWGLVTLPSSAERAAFRHTYQLVAELAIRAVAACGDTKLMAELLEELQAHSIPQPSVEDAQNRSLSALTSALALDLMRPDVAGYGTAAAESYIVEQDTILVSSARIRTPWNTIALERYHDHARRYGRHVVGDRTVTLTIAR